MRSRSLNAEHTRDARSLYKNRRKFDNISRQISQSRREYLANEEQAVGKTLQPPVLYNPLSVNCSGGARCDALRIITVRKTSSHRYRGAEGRGEAEGIKKKYGVGKV